MTTRLVSSLLITVLCAGCASNPAGTDDDAFDRARVVSALRSAGVSVAEGDVVEQPFFSAPGRVLVVDGEDVQVFEYASGSAAAGDAARVSPDGGSVGTSMVAWIGPPHFYRRDRVIALYVGAKPSVISALTAAFGPQFAGR